MKKYYCPLCGEELDDPICSSCGDVSGCHYPKAYELHGYEYYIQKQIEVCGEVITKPVNYLGKDE